MNYSSNENKIGITKTDLTFVIPTLTLQFQKIHPDAVIPTYAHNSDAGMDIYTVEDSEIRPGETALIRTGLKAKIPEGFELQIRPRSGVSLKTKLRIANTPGTIDSGYRDEICVIAENTDIGHWEFFEEPDVHYKFIKGDSIKIKKGDRIAQFVFSMLTKIKIEEVREIDNEGDRGGGFGSTDKVESNCKVHVDFAEANNSDKETNKGGSL